MFRKVHNVSQEINLDDKMKTPNRSSFIKENPLCQRKYSYDHSDIYKIWNKPLIFNMSISRSMKQRNCMLILVTLVKHYSLV